MKVPEMVPWVGDAEHAAMGEAIADTWITEGPRSAELGRRLNALVGSEYGVFAPNGTLALYLGLAAIGIGPGDEVLVPDSTFVGSATAVLLAGGTPVFVGVNDRNFQLDVDLAAKRVTGRTKAVMPVHLYGMTADMTRIVPFAERHGLAIIEDAAQAIGVRYRGRHAGSFGDVGCFSFFADKTITTGEGGYVVCRDADTYERLRMLRNQGRIDRGSFIHPSVGYNLRITDVQAAMGLVQLDRLDEIIARKQRILEQYRSRLADVPELRFLEVEAGSEYVPFRVVVHCARAAVLREFLASSGVASRSFFYPLHKQPCFDGIEVRAPLPDPPDVYFASSLRAYEHSACLPVFPTLEPEQVDYVCDRVVEFFGDA